MSLRRLSLRRLSLRRCALRRCLVISVLVAVVVSVVVGVLLLLLLLGRRGLTLRRFVHAAIASLRRASARVLLPFLGVTVLTTALARDRWRLRDRKASVGWSSDGRS